MGTFGTNRIYTVGRVVKVEDLMRFERFAPRGFDSLRISNAKFITNPHLIRSATLTIRPTEYMRLVPNVPITCDRHVMGTFGTNIIYSVGRMVKVADRMRWGFVPAWVRFPPYLKCKIHELLQIL